MKTLMLIPQAFYTTRGTPLSAYHRTKEFIARGHEVDILTYPVGEPPPDLDAIVYRARGPHFAKRIKQGPSKLKIWFDLLIFINLIHRLSSKRYDLIYAHEEGAFMAALVSPIFRIPFIYDMHSSLPLQITDWKFSESRLVIGLFSWVERLMLQRARAVVAIAPALAEIASRATSPEKVVTIVNDFQSPPLPGADEAARLRKDLNIARDGKVVLYTGSFVPLQALDLLIRAIPRVVESIPEATFVLVGGTPEKIAEYEALGAEVGATDNLVLLAARPQSEMPLFMAACDLLVSPRTQGVNPPGKLISYLSSGRPVVASDTLVHNQILDDSCAFLTQPDPQSLAEGIIDALRNSHRVGEVLAGARRMLDTKFSSTKRDETYSRLIELVSSS